MLFARKWADARTVRADRSGMPSLGRVMGPLAVELLESRAEVERLTRELKEIELRCRAACEVAVREQHRARMQRSAVHAAYRVVLRAEGVPENDIHRYADRAEAIIHLAGGRDEAQLDPGPVE